MKTMRTVREIRDLLGRIYVRWSNSYRLDTRRGYSLRCGTRVESGLSCCEIDKSWPNWRIIRQLREYQFTGARHCWLLSGDEVGRGGDNEPLLRNVRCIGFISGELLTTDYEIMRLEETIQIEEQRLGRITDRNAIDITVRHIADLNAQLAARNPGGTK